MCHFILKSCGTPELFVKKMWDSMISLVVHMSVKSKLRDNSRQDTCPNFQIKAILFEKQEMKTTTKQHDIYNQGSLNKRADHVNEIFWLLHWLLNNGKT